MFDCQSARDIVAENALGQAAVAAPRLAEARSHIAGCAACRDALARFSRAIASHDPDELPCSEVRMRLGTGTGGEMPMVRRHLAHCPACTAEAAAWERITAQEAAGALAEPARYPVFDLAFLPQPNAIWETVRRSVQRLAYEIPAALALAGTALISPLPGLAVSYAAVQARRRSKPAAVAPAAVSENIITLAVDDREADVRISLHVTEAEKAIWLAVSLHTLSSGGALTGERVALCNEQGQAQEIKTVRAGDSEARFPDLTPGRYLIRVERSGRIWELPVNL